MTRAIAASADQLTMRAAAQRRAVQRSLDLQDEGLPPVIADAFGVKAAQDYLDGAAWAAEQAHAGVALLNASTAIESATARADVWVAERMAPARSWGAFTAARDAAGAGE